MASIIGKRYGNAVFELARDGGWIDTLEEEVLAVKEAFTSHDMSAFLTHPSISTEEKIEVVKKSLESKVRDELVGLFCLLIKKGRIEYFHDIFEEIEESIDEYHGKTKAYVKSAYSLSEEEKTHLEKRLSELTKKEVIAFYKVDESLLGGLVIRIGDKVVDSSIKGHLRSMKRELLNQKAV